MIKLADITSKIRAKIIIQAYEDWLKPQTKLVDVGCGTGVVAFEISKSIRTDVYGCDVQNYLLRKIKFKKIKSDNRLPFPDKSFDLALLNDVLHHVNHVDQIGLIDETLRIAKETLIFELKPTIIGKALDFLLNKIHNPEMAIPFAYRNEWNWEKLFKENGITYKKRHVLTPFYYPFSHVAYKLIREV